MVSQEDPNEEFRRLFEALKTQINIIAGADSREMKLEIACERSRRVRNLSSEIRHVRDVRNVTAHPSVKSQGPAVVVTPDLIKRTQRLINTISSIRTANEVGVALGTLYTATINTKLIDITNVMREDRFSHVPVLDGRGRVIGVFNEAAIFDYLMSQSIIELNDTMLINEILAHCELEAGHTEQFRFIRPATSEDEMLDHLLNVQGPFTRVGALFVTPSGKQMEPLSRMITIWDVMSGGS